MSHFLILAGVIVGALGCGEINGAQPLAGVAHYQPTDGSWSLDYLSPPWLLVTTSGESAGLAVAPSLLSIDILHATATLAIAPQDEAAAPAAALALASWKAENPSNTTPATPTVIENRAGQKGIEFVAADPSSHAFHREAYFDAPDGCFGLVFDGTVPLDTTDVTSVITGFVTAQ